MNTEKAIDILGRLKNPHLKWLKKHNDDIDEIIELLQRGEKYKKIIEQLKRNYGHNNVQFGFGEGETLTHAINHLMWIYFPKSVKDKDYFYEATSKDPHLKRVKFKKGGSQ